MGTFLRQTVGGNGDKNEQIQPHLQVGLGPHVQDESSSPFLPERRQGRSEEHLCLVKSV